MSQKNNNLNLFKVRRNSTVEYIKRQTIERMQLLGVYREEYDDLITVYADTLRQYHRAYKKFIDEGEQYEVPTENGTTKKSGIVSAMEILRKDIGTLSDRLMLNPKANVTKETTQLPPEKMNTENLLELLDEKLSA